MKSQTARARSRGLGSRVVSIWPTCALTDRYARRWIPDRFLLRPVGVLPGPLKHAVERRRVPAPEVFGPRGRHDRYQLVPRADPVARKVHDVAGYLAIAVAGALVGVHACTAFRALALGFAFAFAFDFHGICRPSVTGRSVSVRPRRYEGLAKRLAKLVAAVRDD